MGTRYTTADPPARPASGNYLDPGDLARMIRQYQKPRPSCRQVSDEFGLALLAIAGGVWDRFRFGPDREEFQQECLLHFLSGTALARVSPKGNAFSYLTTCAVWFGGKLRARAARDLAREIDTHRRRAEDLGDGLADLDVDELLDRLDADQLAGDRAEDLAAP